jgi:uncharacterized damage-inducible protein DinB
MTEPHELASSFIDTSRRYLTHEYLPRIRLCVESLPVESLWWRPSERANSIGNLMLHLSGNVRQWIVSGVGGASDHRDRDREFAHRDPLTGEQLLATLGGTVNEADAVIASLTPERLLEERPIQGRTMSVLRAVYHVVEHFSMHTGQIIYIAKAIDPERIRFYDDTGGLGRPLWPGAIV